MGKKVPKEAYVVFRGRNPGIYRSWPECDAQVTGFGNSKHQGYERRQDAEEAWNDWVKATRTSIFSASGTTGSGSSSTVELGNRQPLSPVHRNRSSPVKYNESPLHLQQDQQHNSLEKSPYFADVTGLEKAKRLSVFGAQHLDSGLKRCAPLIDLTCSDDEQAPGTKKPKSEGDNFKSECEYELLENEDPAALEETAIQLTPAQEAVVSMAVKGDNIFLTGAAGSGKTSTLKEILRRLNVKYRRKSKYPRVQVVAPTGIAALPLGGKTTYSFAGWIPDSLQKPLFKLFQFAKKSVREAMDELRVLIIEEISMVENQFLERLNLFMQNALGSSCPFGGKQVIFLGDFHQLPPVKPFQYCLSCGREMKLHNLTHFCSFAQCDHQRTKIFFKLGDKWAFKAPVWEQLNLRHVKLEQIHRQKDTGFQSILNQIRNGESITDDEWAALERKKTLPPGAFAVRLMSLLYRVNDFNSAQLFLIKSEQKAWTAMDTGRKLHKDPGDDIHPRSLQISLNLEEHVKSLKYHRFPENLNLKVGAKVVLLSNINPDGGLVNGSQGEVIGFQNQPEWKLNELQQILEGKNKRKAWKSQQILDYIGKNSLCPLVRFANGREELIGPVAQESLRGVPAERYEVCRTQIPLTLGWALSIHKSQGMTLEYVEVSKQDIFESGQLYVGLSRATKLEGLTVTGYSRSQTAVDQDVLEFYRSTKWEDLGPSNVLGLNDATRTDVIDSNEGILGANAVGSESDAAATFTSYKPILGGKKSQVIEIPDSGEDSE